MTSPVLPSRAAGTSLYTAFLPLLPYMLSMFGGFLAIGMAFPVVPRFVHDSLGQGAAVVGLVMGSQFVSCFFGRLWAGHVVDTRGPQVAVRIGMAAAAGAGLVYLACVPFAGQPAAAVAVLVAARLLTGVAESFTTTGTLPWGIARVGPAHTGKVLGWVGVALFAALGFGAPLGTALYDAFGFRGFALAVIAVPLVALAGTTLIAPVHPSAAPRLPFTRVLGVVRLPGLGLLLCAGAYAMITAFIVLLFAQRGWAGGALGVTCMGAGFIVARLVFGHLPDQIGGARVTLACVVVEAVGLLLIWGAPMPALAWLGAALAGGGYGLGFQGFGVEAIKRAPPQSRGSAMGAYVAFQDIAMGLAPPLGGVLAQAAGLDAVYIAAAVMALGAAAVSLAMLRAR